MSAVDQTLFISDLHLDGDRPAVVDLFLDFLDQRASRAADLYILGDFFEVWIGDDDDSPLARMVSDQLHALTRSGIPVYLMHGNRDFLLGERFAGTCGCTLLEDPTVIDLYGTPTLLTHGDTLCTDDHEYQSFRTQVRSPAWQEAFLARPLAERAAVARELRTASRRKSRDKPRAIMDVNDAAVTAAMREHGLTQMIHGHTHRPAIHHLELDGRPARRMVLGDWGDSAEILVADAAGCRLETVSAGAAALGVG